MFLVMCYYFRAVYMHWLEFLDFGIFFNFIVGGGGDMRENERERERERESTRCVVKHKMSPIGANCKDGQGYKGTYMFLDTS